MALSSAHSQTCGLRDNGDGTMTDPGTGLQIRRCPEGSNWSGGRCNGDAKTYKWDDAVQRFGRGEWRLITVEEAVVVVDRSKYCENVENWKALPNGRDSKYATFIVIGHGMGDADSYRNPSDQYAVMLVRAGQPSGSSTASSSSNSQRPAPAQNTQQAAAQNQSTQSQNQAAQQQSQQAQQTAQQNQTRADQARQGKRKTNDPAAQAHECIELDKAPGLFGGFKNSCNFKVNFSTCNYKPRIKQGGFNWSADFDCEKGQYGLHTPSARETVAAHNHNTEMVYWFACKAPATPVDAAFVLGKGIEARCHN